MSLAGNSQPRAGYSRRRRSSKVHLHTKKLSAGRQGLKSTPTHRQGAFAVGDNFSNSFYAVLDHFSDFFMPFWIIFELFLMLICSLDYFLTFFMLTGSLCLCL